jgi:site-specific DNA recombinase
MQTDFLSPPSLSTVNDSTTDPISGIDSRCMTKAALYARVSTDGQQKEGTIASQLAELRKQVAAAGHELVKEYLDDGFSGSLLDRPALNQLRADLKSDLFDAIYFLSPDRIAREVEYQQIIVGEILKHRKRMFINGEDYEHNPENKMMLIMLGTFAEFERAKITERMTRGRLHKLRMGQMSSNGQRIYGYDYIRRTDDAPATLAINEEQAAVVRSIFEMFASGNFGLVTIVRHLEANRIPTCGGKTQWDNDRIKTMLKNETYAGIRYFNRMTRVKKSDREGRKLIRGQWVYRDPSEWIAVKVPAIVSRELFDQVQARLRTHQKRYCKPATHYLLSGLVQCGVCGGKCSSTRGYRTLKRPSGKVSVYHFSTYRCNRRARENMHDRTQIEHCTNSSIATHILEAEVCRVIAEAMIDPGKMRGCMKAAEGADDRSTARELSLIARKISTLDHERRRLIDRYAADQLAGEDYIQANRALDSELAGLVREKTRLAAALRSPNHEDFVDASVRQFCATAKARWYECTNDEMRRQFVLDFIERVVFDHYKVTVIGSVPVADGSSGSSIPFRIKGEINQVAVRKGLFAKAALEQSKQYHVLRAAVVLPAATI